MVNGKGMGHIFTNSTDYLNIYHVKDELAEFYLSDNYHMYSNLFGAAYINTIYEFRTKIAGTIEVDFGVR